MNDGSLGIMGFFLMKKLSSFIRVGFVILYNGNKLGNNLYLIF
jgi:hypothetical protein